MSEDIKRNQIISIVGATATGKTALALQLANKLIAEEKAQKVFLLSADSRQVYQGLENLTGADLPANFTRERDSNFDYSYFTNPKKNIFLFGSSIIPTTAEWSVAHFQKLFKQLQKNLSEKDFLIVVGGTGFYQQQVWSAAETISIPQNQTLRQKLATLSTATLQKQLDDLDHTKLTKMNHSDLNNPRRLVRAIEIASYKSKHSVAKNLATSSNKKIFYLELPKKLREEKIKQRVLERFALAKQEVAQQLIHKQISPLASTCTGFAQLQQLLNKTIDQNTCIEKWQLSEIQYAKRQDTWWKKRSDLIKIDIEKTKTITDKIIATCYI